MRSSLAVAAGVVLAAASLLPACTKTAGVADIYMSLDEDGARKRELFFTDSASITCVFKVGVGRANATFSALIRQIRELPFGQGGDDFQPVNRVITSGDFHPGVTNGTPTLLTLKMVPSTIDPTTNEQKQDEDAPFAPGSYRCEVSIDGVPTDVAAFNIAYPDCPTAQIATGQKCAGFYAFSPPTTCPKNGASGDPEPTCSCNGDKGWECQ
jgi:hypothetical protein